MPAVFALEEYAHGLVGGADLHLVEVRVVVLAFRAGREGFVHVVPCALFLGGVLGFLGFFLGGFGMFVLNA